MTVAPRTRAVREATPYTALFEDLTVKKAMAGWDQNRKCVQDGRRGEMHARSGAIRHSRSIDPIMMRFGSPFARSPWIPILGGKP
jgi:hypothetical protein